jgi:hypothetical protein
LDKTRNLPPEHYPQPIPQTAHRCDHTYDDYNGSGFPSDFQLSFEKYDKRVCNAGDQPADHKGHKKQNQPWHQKNT